MIFRLLFIVTFIYLISLVVKRIIVRPFRQGYQDKDFENRRKSAQNQEGSISIEKNGADKSRDAKSLGEYVDYEEVDDEASPKS